MSLLPVDHICLRNSCPSDTFKGHEMEPVACPNCHSSMYAVPLQALSGVQEKLAPQTTFQASRAKVADRVTFLRDYCYAASRAAGWWDDERSPMTFAVKLALIHSEVSEALEGDRKGTQDEHLPHRPSREVELADALIRIFDLAGAYDLDIGGALAEKMQYNAKRADHKPEARRAAGGKAY